MSRGPHSFKQRDVTRAIKAVRAAGIADPSVKIDRAGNIYILPKAETSQTVKADTSWDDDAPEAAALR
jgi:hypothetical protein